MRAAALAAAVLAASCATAPPPSPGAPIRLEVLHRFGPEPSEQRPLRALLAGGLAPEAVRDGRLVGIACAEEAPGGTWRETRFWALFPPGQRAPEHHGVAFDLAFAPPSAPGRPGEALALLDRPPPLREVPFGPGLTRRLPDCGSGVPDRLQGRITLLARQEMLDRIAWEDAWLAALPMAAMREGRIVMARCASAPDEVRSAIAEAPPGAALAAGTVFEGIAGVPAQGAPGPVARLLRPVAGAPTLPVRSQSLVDCAVPLSPSPRG